MYRVMGVQRVEQLVAFRLAVEFKREVYRLVRTSCDAVRDFKFKDQTFDAAAGIERSLNEGFGRRSAAEFSLFIGYSLGSLNEAVGHVRDGVDRGYFLVADCQDAFTLGRRCGDAMRKLDDSLQQFIAHPTGRRARLRSPNTRSPRRP